MRTNRGFSLIETTFATLLVAILMVTSLGTFAHVITASTTDSQQLLAAKLAQLLLSEVTSKPFTSPTNSTTSIGQASGEGALPRSLWNDCDDYHGVTLNPIVDDDGSAIPSASGWRASFTVQYAEPNTPNVPVSYATDVKLVTLTLTDPGSRTHVFTSLRSRHGVLQQAQNSDVLSSIRFRCVSNAAEADYGTRILNQQGAP